MAYTPPSGSDVELVFDSTTAPPPGNAVGLNFNPFASELVATLEDVSGVISVTATGLMTVAATLEGLSCEIIAGVFILAALDATLEDVTVQVNADWEAGVWRGVGLAKQGNHIENTTPAARGHDSGLRQGLRTYNEITGATALPEPLQFYASVGWTEVPGKSVKLQGTWERSEPLSHSGEIRYSAPPHKALTDQGAWQLGTRLGKSTQSTVHITHQVPLLRTFKHKVSWRILGRNYLLIYGVGSNKRRQWVCPWEVANPHSWIWGGWNYPQPKPPPVFVPSTLLQFYQRAEIYTGGAILVFGKPCFAWPLKNNTTTLFKGAIIVLHTIHVKRLPDMLEIQVLSADLKFDIDSWAWGVSLNLQTPQTMSLLEPVNGEPRQVRIELDGFYFHALIEEWGESRQFGQTLYTASGRSPLALLAEPFAPVRSYLETTQQTAAQLIDHELLNTGWSATYHSDLLQLFTTDWLVPDGAWSYQNKAPIDAIVQIARAAGARAYADRTASLVHIDPRYPVSPWNWSVATPDKSIPSSLVRSIATQLMPQPDYNHVYVSGQTQGVLISASRQGSAGDKTAPMITDNLITYVNAGRERARTILANTGRQARVTLDLPLTEITGLVEPGQLIELSDSITWRGLVTGTTVNASHSIVHQTVEIERHYQ